SCKHCLPATPHADERKQTRAAADIHERSALNCFAANQTEQRVFSLLNARLVNLFGVLRPVVAEPEVRFQLQQVLCCHHFRPWWISFRGCFWFVTTRALRPFLISRGSCAPATAEFRVQYTAPPTPPPPPAPRPASHKDESANSWQSLRH